MLFLKIIYRAARNFFWYIFQRSGDEKWYKTHILVNQEEQSQKGRKYYIIRREDKAGIFSYIQTTIGQIIYAKEHNMIPIVDMKNVPNSYLEENEIGKYNAWEFYFKQICNADLDEVYRSGNYEISKDNNIDLRRTPGMNGLYQKRAYYFFANMYQHYVVFNKETEDYCKRELKEILQGRECATLGVLVRGTDYKYAIGHEKQPELEEVIQTVKKILDKHLQFQYIYLATDEQRTEDRFRQEFPGIVLVNKRTYFDQFDFSNQLLADVRVNRSRDKYYRGLEYLSSINILSKCGGLCAGLCGGTYGAYYMNQGKYKLFKYWNLGNMKEI